MLNRNRLLICFTLIVLMMIPKTHLGLAQDGLAQDGQTRDGLIQDRETQDELTQSTQDQSGKNQDGLIVDNLSIEEKRAIRRQIMEQFVATYTGNQVFDKIAQYMLIKYQEMEKNKTPRYPDVILKDTFEKANNLIVQTKKIIGGSFSKVYDPDQIEKKVRKYLWLKGLCFFALGINDEHRLAVSYFYLPGNEEIRKDFLYHVVRFSFPEVPDKEENKVWLEKMSLVMDRLGYDIFSIKKFGIIRNDLDQGIGF
jgi:hypothetical protein